MPLHKLSQKSFVNGQYDRTAQNQESASGAGIVARGLSYAKNVLSSDKGELRKRLGTKFLKKLPGSAVIIPFRMPDEDDAILVADTTNIVGYKYYDGELENLNSVTADAVISFPANNTWGNGTAGANSVSNGDWTLNFSFPRATSGWLIPIYYYPGDLIKNTDGGFHIAPEKQTAPQYIGISNTNTQSCLRSIKLWFWTDNETGYIYKHWTNPVIEYSDDGNTWVGVQTDYSVGEYTPVSYTPSERVNTEQGVITIPANYKSKCSMTIKQVNYGVKHNYWRVYFQTGRCGTGIKIDNVDVIDPGNTTHFVQTSPYTEEQLKNIKYSQDKNEMFIACEDVTPYKFVNNNGQLSLTAFAPTVGGQTIWEINGGYPAAVSLFQNRVWFGGFENNPTKVIASKFDDYDNFTTSSPLNKDDRLDLRCNQLKTKIKNMVGGQNVMCCFSDDGVSYIDGGSTGLLATNENIEFRLKNRMPAGSSTPGFKDDVMLYSSSDGTKLYGVDFDLIVNRFQVSDLAIYAKDVTQDKITELHYVNNESKLVYGLTEAGKMFALLYEKGAYQGFFPLDFNGVIYDICPVKVGRDYKLLMVVFRDGDWYLEEKLDCGQYIDTSTPRLTAEEKKWATYDNLENNVALDCYQTYDESFAAESQIIDDNTIYLYTDRIIQDRDKNKSFMIATDGSKDFATFTLDDYSESWQTYDLDETFTRIIYGDNKFVAFYYTTGSIYTSTDGAEWTHQTDLGLGVDDMIYANNKFYAVKRDGHIYTSTDAETWTDEGQQFTGTHAWHIAYDGNIFVVVDNNGYISTSSDGITWATPTQDATLSADSYGWKSVIFGNGNFVVFGSNYASVSTDGVTWATPTALNLYYQSWSFCFANDQFVAIGNSGDVSFSPDGLTWADQVSVPYTINTKTFAYGGGNFVLMKQMTLQRKIVISPDISKQWWILDVTMEARRGESTQFTRLYPAFTQFKPNLPVVDVAVISEGRYFNATKPDIDELIYLPAPCHKVIYGIPYEALAIFKIQTPYESLKNVAQVDVSVIDTTHLEIGTSFEDTQNIEKIDDSSYYDLTRITMNDTYRIVTSDTPEMTKNVILRSNKGVPFTVNAVDIYISYSNLGGD